MLWSSIYLIQWKPTFPSESKAHKQDKKTQAEERARCSIAVPFVECWELIFIINVRRFRARHKHVQSLKILIYMLAQVFLCHFQAFTLNFSLSPPSLTLHARLLTLDNGTTPLFPAFLNSPFNSISLFLIHSAQFSPPSPKSLNA